MDIYHALLLFSLVILFYWVIAELFTFFFRFTGLPAEKARFQVISLLTGTGFTTRESEIILSSRRRRRLARITMLFGYVFNLTIVSAFINLFFSMKRVQAEHQLSALLIPLGAVALIFVCMRVPKIHAWGDDLFVRVADRVFDRKETFNAVMMVDNIRSESIAQVTLRHIPEEYRGLIPPGTDPQYFLCALYSLERQKKLAQAVPPAALGMDGAMTKEYITGISEALLSTSKGKPQAC